jgi:UDP-N-acetylmuramate dehydrogenase
MVNFEENVPLSPFTSFHIGGPAQYFARVGSIEDIAEALSFAQRKQLPIFVLGGGSNLLISDKGIAGLVIKIENGGVFRDEQAIMAGAGAPLGSVVDFAIDQGLQGVEVLAGIPGLIGGAVRGNAGAFGTDIGTNVLSVIAFHQKTLETKVFTHDDCQFSYRDSFFKQHAEWIVFGVSIGLTTGDADALRKIADETRAKREAKHPQAAWCAGSFFMNPVVTDEALRKEFESETGVKLKDDKLPAGWLVAHVGLRGKAVGGAKVSDIHPNYIVNTGTATAEEVIMLSSLIKQKVRTELNIRLIEEAQLVGF